ncbi:siderophore-interacting protein [Agromyces seonyuensis]|uniref:Siderophore-interacting protein n=1 Tax=Agromyces seonyuensis TaxID=2662446 RepID=A0A6I4P513_9MICO|nr:siderophore-interacting protein [Agromyces seonyuensis]MWB98577.1 siderophore-interacting protein [Agromyces seonyuensis]
MPFTLERTPRDLVFRRARLTARTAITADYVRLRFEGEELRGFGSAGADDHIRIFVAPIEEAPDGAEFPTPEAFRAGGSREYTPLEWDAEAGVLEVEFLLHGDDGVAGPFAANAELGAPVAVGGPRGSMVMAGHPDAWFLAGDETAVPAIRRHLANAGPDAVGLVVLESDDAAHDIPIDPPAGVEVRRAHRPDGGLVAALDALTEADRPAGDVFAFVAAEQAIVKPGRALVFDRWGIAPEHAVIKGYWKRGEREYHAPH